MINSVYASLSKLKTEITAESPGSYKGDNDRLKDVIFRASRAIDAACGLESQSRQFYPLLETRFFDHPGDSVQSYGGLLSSGVSAGSKELTLNDDLLESYEVKTNNLVAVVPDNSYFLLQTLMPPKYVPPFNYVVIPDNSSHSFLCGNTPMQANSIKGLWGFHQHWGQAWHKVGMVQNDPLSDTGTNLILEDVKNGDPLGVVPWSDWGQTLKIGDDFNHTTDPAEMVFVKDVDLKNNTLTIERGVNGTVKHAWNQNTDVYLYLPMSEIVKATHLMASWLFRRQRGIGKDHSDRRIVTAAGTTILPDQLPSEIAEIIDRYRVKAKPVGMFGTVPLERGGSWGI